MNWILLEQDMHMWLVVVVKKIYLQFFLSRTRTCM